MKTHKNLLVFPFLVFNFFIVGAKGIVLDSQPNHNWVWDKSEQPELIIQATDTAMQGGEIEIKVCIKGDTEDSPIYFDEAFVGQMNGDGVTSFSILPSLPSPGFYRVNVSAKETTPLNFNIGISPEEVISPSDSPADLKNFWDQALSELAEIPMNATMVEIPEKSGEKRKIYFCQYLSLDNDTVSGYLALPVKEGKYPAIIYYNGYNGRPWDIDPDGMEDWIEFQHWVRGQGPNKPYNKYDEYALYHLEDPSKYYYRGGFMDAIRSIDFIESLPQTNKDLIFAEGGSQGGAFTFAAAALDPKKRLKGIAPYIPFLSDYPDYFKIVHWPGDMVKQRSEELGMTEEELYHNLSYFDIKNLTPWISIPVLMGVGLQDPTCPPHTNFAGYNNLNSQKEYVIYPLCGHTVDYTDWNPRRIKFFKDIIDKQ